MVLPSKELQHRIKATFDTLRQGPYSRSVAYTFVYEFFFYKWVSENQDHFPRLGLLRRVSHEDNYQYSFDVISREMEILQGEYPFSKLFQDAIDFIRDFRSYADRILHIWKDTTFNPTLKNENIIFPETFFQLLLSESPSEYEFTTPPSIRSLIAKIADAKEFETVYNPACGVGGLITELASQKELRKKARFILQDINANLLKFCRINMLVFGVKHFDIRIENMFLPSSNPREKFRADVIVCNPPFGLKLESFFKEEFGRNFDLSLLPRTGDALVVSMALSQLNFNGRAVLLLPESFFFSTTNQQFRKKLVESNLIEGVVSLPNWIFPNMRVKCSLLLLNNRKREEREIMFIKYSGSPKAFSIYTISEIADIVLDFRKMHHLREKHGDIEYSIETPQKIEEADFNLTADYYTHVGREELRSILSESGNEVQKIKNLIKSSHLGRPIIEGDKLGDTNIAGMPFVKVADLSEVKDDFFLDLGKVRNVVINGPYHRSPVVIYETAIIVGLIGSKLKAALFQYEGKPIVLAQHVLGLVLKPEIDPLYFISQLNSHFVEIQFEMRSAGVAIPYLRKDNFLDISIILPSLAEQKRQILESRSKIEERTRLTEEKEQADSAVLQTEYDVVAVIAHNLNQKLGSIVNDFSTLKAFLNRKEKSQSQFLLSEPAVPVFDGENIDDVTKVSDILSRMTNNLEDATNTLKRTTDVLQLNTIKPELTNLLAFLKSIQKEFPSEKYQINIKGKKIEVMLDRALFKDAIRNLLENAKIHGFLKPDVKYLVEFEVEKWVDEKQNLVHARIAYRNNGKPFPNSFSFEEYKKFAGRGGSTKGTGLGGFFINRVIELHNGKLNFIPFDESTLSGFNVEFEILLPIQNP